MLTRRLRIYFALMCTFVLLSPFAAIAGGRSEEPESGQSAPEPTPVVSAAESTRNAERANVAIFSGPTSTIQNTGPFITSNKAREMHGLPLMLDHDGEPKMDVPRHQRIAAPVTVYIEQFSAHPLESDAADLYGPPDGYIDSAGEFHTEQQNEGDTPVYEVTLEPEDGLYKLPYMSRTADGSAWDGNCHDGECRQSFYPDMSRVFEEIERQGGDFYAKADYSFYRPAPSAGYRQGLAEEYRTDVGEGDIPPETMGEHFFAYGAGGRQAPRGRLAYATNMIQEAMGSGEYVGGIWLEGSPNVEDSIYWFSLLIDTDVPFIGNAAHWDRMSLSEDGSGNMEQSINFLTSDVWRDESGTNRVGGVMIEAGHIMTARDVQKTDSRPGAYNVTGGHGGVIGNSYSQRITFLPTRRSLHTSMVNMSQLPGSVPGATGSSGSPSQTEVDVKNSAGELLGEAIPNVTIVKQGRWNEDSADPDAERQAADILAQIERNLEAYPLSGFVGEGTQPFAGLSPSLADALNTATFHGMPVVMTGRGNNEGFASTGSLQIGAGNLTSTKARILLMAAMLRYGSLPVPSDPSSPSDSEIEAIEARIAQYQEIFDTH